MKSIRFLHITDFHFGNGSSPYANSVNVKDNAFPKKLVNQLNTTWTYDFIEGVKGWIRTNNTKIDSVIFTGDLGEKGIPNNTEAGIEFLLAISNNIDVENGNLVLCPGNHDLQRENSNKEFEEYERILKKHDIQNYSCYDQIYPIEIHGIPVISINSCLGGTAKSQYADQHKLILDKLSKTDKDKIQEEHSKLGLSYMNDFLDIPAIGKNQIQNLLEYVGKSNSDSAIIVMHHNPVPNNVIEIRPYSNLVDSGKFLTSLLETRKKAFIFHGHTHFDYDILSYFPNGKGNYISSVGCGALNDTQSSRGNIYEFYFTDDNKHIISKLHRITKSGGAGFSINHSHNVFEKGFEKDEDKIWAEFTKIDKPTLFRDLSNLVTGVDDGIILKFILKQESTYLLIDKKKNDNYQDWIITRID